MYLIDEFHCASLAWEFFDRETDVVLRLPPGDAQTILVQAGHFEYSGFMDKVGSLISSGKSDKLIEMLHGSRATYSLQVRAGDEPSAAEERVSESLLQLAVNDPGKFYAFYRAGTSGGGFFDHLSSSESVLFLSALKNQPTIELSAAITEAAENLDEFELRAFLTAEGNLDADFLGAILAAARAKNLSAELRDEIAGGLQAKLVVASILNGLESPTDGTSGRDQDVLSAGMELLLLKQAQQMSGEQSARLASWFLERVSPHALFAELGGSIEKASVQTIFTAAVREWSRYDPVGASAFLANRVASGENVPAGAIGALAGNLEQYPEAAAAWALLSREK